MTRLRLVSAALGAAALGLGCASDAAERGLGLAATGVVEGIVLVDRDGSGSTTAPDAGLVGLRVALLAPVGPDTTASTLTDTAGAFRFERVPVGQYRLAFDAAPLGDSLVVSGLPAGALLLRAGDTLTLTARVAFPQRSAADVRTAPLGTRAIVTAVALHAATLFSDSLLHVADASGALRASRIRPAAIVAGDSLRLIGRVVDRDGQRVLDDVTTYALGSTFLPPAVTLSTAAAATAGGGVRDAALVRVVDAAVVDTLTVAGNLRVTVDDGSGPMVLWLDRVADAAFRPPYPATLTQAGARLDAVGVLTPLGAGAWALRPRALADVVPR